jgi:hypothetical protein
MSAAFPHTIGHSQDREQARAILFQAWWQAQTPRKSRLKGRLLLITQLRLQWRCGLDAARRLREYAPMLQSSNWVRFAKSDGLTGGVV